MTVGIRTRLFLAWLGPIAAALLVAGVFLGQALDRLFVGHIREDLLVRLELCERDASAAASGAEPLDWNALAHDLGRRAHARVTLIAPDGKVLGDSELSDDAIGHTENHLDRPEVRQALERGTGVAVRHSATLRARLMYAARRFGPAGTPRGVVRLSVPLKEVDAAVRRLHRLLFAGSLLGLGVALVMAVVGSHLISRSLRHLTAIAARMAAGDLKARARLQGRDEIAALGHTLDDLAKNLSESLETVRAERDLLQRILTSMTEGILLLDGSGRVVLVNPALRAMLLLGSEVEGKPVLDVVRHAQLQELLEKARSADEGAAAEIEIAGLRPRRLLTGVRRLQGEPPGLLAVFVDVTELRRLEAVRREFVANASHELRTPVATIRSAAETLRDAAARDPEAATRFLQMIERNAERLQRLVDDLLEISRVEARELKLSVEPTPLPPIARHLLGLFSDRASQRQIRLVHDIPSDLPPLLVDRRALEQILSNLLDNATKYASKGTTVSLRARVEGPRVAIEIEDTGPGIEAKHLPRLFERFYRVDAGRSRELGGTGLGLAIVKHLTEAMGGSVSVESAVGVGSTFTVVLPSAASSERPAPATQPPPSE